MTAILELDNVPTNCYECQLTRTYITEKGKVLECKYSNECFIDVTEYKTTKHPSCKLRIEDYDLR